MQFGYNGKFKEMWLIKIRNLNFTNALCKLQIYTALLVNPGLEFRGLCSSASWLPVSFCQKHWKEEGGGQEGTFLSFTSFVSSNVILGTAQLVPFPRFSPPWDNLVAHLSPLASGQGLFLCALKSIPQKPFLWALEMSTPPVQWALFCSVCPVCVTSLPFVPWPCGWTCCQQLLLLPYLWLFQASNMFTQFSVSNSVDKECYFCFLNWTMTNATSNVWKGKKKKSVLYVSILWHLFDWQKWTRSIVFILGDNVGGRKLKKKYFI